jgi:hypothetical protein
MVISDALGLDALVAAAAVVVDAARVRLAVEDGAAVVDLLPLASRIENERAPAA